jgi:hypothetical protein
MINQTQTTSFKTELYEGIHNFLTDSIMMALYTAYASLDQTTTVYTATNEVIGAGYTAGGILLTNVVVGNDGGYIAYVSFGNAVWTPAYFTCRGALLYNASKGNRAIAVIDFGVDKTANNSFTVTMPLASGTTAIIRSSN